MAVNPNDILTVTDKGSLSTGGDIQNVYTVQYQGGSSVAEADVLTDLIAIFEAIAVILAPILSTLRAMDSIRVVNRTQNSDVGETVYVTTVAGSVGGDTGTPQNCYGVTLKTADLSIVGRKFLGPVPEGKSAAHGAFDASVATPIADFIVKMITQQTAPSTRPYRFGVVRSADSVFLPFTSSSFTGRQVTQRRRRVGVGT